MMEMIFIKNFNHMEKVLYVTLSEQQQKKRDTELLVQYGHLKKAKHMYLSTYK